MKIYTGYAWREITEAEREILTPDRFVDKMTEDAQAGGVYEGEAE